VLNSLVLGDLNAHNPLWQSRIQDARGEELANEIDHSDHGMLNMDTQIQLPDHQRQQKSPMETIPLYLQPPYPLKPPLVNNKGPSRQTKKLPQYCNQLQWESHQ
jgi:hypothetical protein